MEKERVLTIPAAKVRSLLRETRFHDDQHKIDEIRSLIRKGEFICREKAEKDNSVMQIIACAVIHNSGRILCVRRTRKTNRDILRLRWTLMFGGHVDQVDSLFPSPVENCMHRELAEELGIREFVTHTLLGIVADFMNPVGSLHLGVVFAVEARHASATIEPMYGKGEFVNWRHQRVSEFVTAADVLKKRSALDPWSRLFIESEAAWKNLNLGTMDLRQRSLTL